MDLPDLDLLSLEELESIYVQYSGFEIQPVDITTFIRDPYYLGRFFADEKGNSRFYDYWFGVLREIYPSPLVSPYWLISLRGSIGRGKTMAACIGMAYDLYLLQCLRSPQAQLGLLPTDKIVFAIMNVTLSLVKDVIWDRLSNMFSLSPYFTSLLDTARSVSKAKSKIIREQSPSVMPKNIDFFSGSRITHTLGRAIYTCIFSEANFEVIDDQVYRSFNSVIARQESRFLSEEGQIAGKTWIDSSEGDRFSTINRITDRYKGQSGVYVNSGPLWYVRPWLYKGNFFTVYKGSDFRRPDIVDYDDPAFIEDPQQILVVPAEHRNRFEADLEQALRDLGGIATTSSYLLFRNKLKLIESLVMTPIFPDVLSVDFDNDEDQIHKHCTSPLYFGINRFKSCPRYIHIDIGLTGDRLGIAATCVTGFKETTTSQDVVDLLLHRDSVPTTLTDFAFGIEAKKGQQVPLFKVRQFLMWLKSSGMAIAKVTLDGYNSADFIQLLTKVGVDSEVVSVDRTSEPYFQLRNAVNEKRSILPTNNILRKELENLEVTSDGKKVDHPHEFPDGERGSKDIADAVCGSLITAIQNSSQYRLLFTSWPAEQDNQSQKMKEVFWPE